MGDIAVITTIALNIGGLGSVVRQAARALCKLGYDRIVIVGVKKRKELPGPFKRLIRELSDQGCTVSTRFLLSMGIPDMASLPIGLLLGKVIKRYDPSIVFDTTTIAIDNALVRQTGTPLIKYYTFPFEVLVRKDLLSVVDKEVRREIDLYLENLRLLPQPRKLYLRLSYSLLGALRRSPPESVITTTSLWTSWILESIYDISTIPLQPYVDIDRYYSNHTESDRSQEIVIFSRITPEKRIHEFLKVVDPGFRIIVAGKLNRSLEWYANRLRKIAKARKINLVIRPNIPQEEVPKILSSARVYVHTMKGEHFGITVVEAMASGTPVIVHRSGGPYFDILSRGKFGLSYENYAEINSLANRLLLDSKTWRTYHRLSVRRAKHYSFKRYIKNMKRAINLSS